MVRRREACALDGRRGWMCEQRKIVLSEGALSGFERELDLWPAAPDVEELKGNLMELFRFTGRCQRERHLGFETSFRSEGLLKEMTLEKKKYLLEVRPMR